MEHHILIKSAINLVSHIAVLTSKEMTVSVADTEKYLVNVPAPALNLKIHPGDPIKPGSIADITLKERTRQVQRIPKEVFGVPFIGVGTPLIDETNRIVGLILTGMPIDDQEDVQKMAESLASTSQQISAAIQNLAANAQELSHTTEDVANEASNVAQEVESLDKIVRIIKGIADRTNILGLNASIEAARAGQAGKGFTVVAEEIRKMASSTQSSTRQISLTLTQIQNLMFKISMKITQIADLFQGQAAATEEIAASTQQIGSMSQSLLELAEKLK